MNFENKMEQLKRHDLNCNIFSAYDYNGLTMQELLCQFFTKINECVDFSNQTLDLANWLVNEGLSQEVVKKLMIWLEDGTLENLINVNLFKSLNDKIDVLNTELETITKKTYISVTDYGAKGDGITDDTESVQKALNDIKANSVLYFPRGSYKIKTLVIPKNKIGLKLFGDSMETTKLIFSTVKAFSCLSGYITFKDMEVQGCGIDNSLLFSDDRDELTADFDITLKYCLFTKSQNLVNVNGRGVTLEGCIIKEWLQGGNIINANFPYPLAPGDSWTQTEITGFRSFIVRNNRFHFVTSTLLNNTGYNANNLSGVHIVGNYIEGPLKIINGYVRDLLYNGNTQYQVPTNTTHKALFTLNGGSNINIDLLFSLSNRETDVGYDSVLISNGITNNLNLTGVVFGLKDKAVVLKGGGSQIKIDLSIRRIQGGTGTHFTHFIKDSTNTTFRNVDVKCRLESPNSNFIGFEVDDTVTVLNYSTELLMSGVYGTYSKGLNPINCISQPNLTKTYLGNGTTNTIDLKFMPRTVQIIGIEGSGELPTYNNLSVANFSSASVVTIKEGGFTVSGAANVSGKKYIYITT
ncbi:MAG: glycosyl hydrolase family 28-related protein [Paraclostridium sp.]